jgi:hypothetical protein
MKRVPQWLLPARCQVLAELHGIAAMLTDVDLDALVDHAICLWVAASRACAERRGPGLMARAPDMADIETPGEGRRWRMT